MVSRWPLAIAKFGSLALLLLQSCSKPVSYSRQIAPIFALHCYGCHGGSSPSSNFTMTTYAGLRKGGTLGDDILPGNAAQSNLVKFVEGFRGPEQRMPQNASPLTAEQIGLIRRWIDQGARQDHVKIPAYRILIPSCAIKDGAPLSITMNVSTEADLLLRILDHDKPIYSEEASIKSPAESMDAGEPGHPMQRQIHWENGWPNQVSVALLIRYASTHPAGSLTVTDGNGKSLIETTFLQTTEDQ